MYPTPWRDALSNIGPEHLRVGSGLHETPAGLGPGGIARHLAHLATTLLRDRLAHA